MTLELTRILSTVQLLRAKVPNHRFMVSRVGAAKAFYRKTSQVAGDGVAVRVPGVDDEA